MKKKLVLLAMFGLFATMSFAEPIPLSGEPIPHTGKPRKAPVNVQPPYADVSDGLVTVELASTNDSGFTVVITDDNDVVIAYVNTYDMCVSIPISTTGAYVIRICVNGHWFYGQFIVE